MQRDEATEGFKKLLDKFQVDMLNNKVTIKDASVGGLKGDYSSDWIFKFDFPDFDKIKKELAEKYKLTPSEEANNKAVELGKKWGTNPNGKKITPYTKALEAGEEHAHLLLNDNGEDEFDPSSVLAIQSLTPVPWGSVSIKDVVKEISTKEELKRFLKENDIDVSKDLKEETVVAIIDKFPDFFEDIELSFTEKEEKRVENHPQLMRNNVFGEATMDAPSDIIYYNNIEIGSDESVKRMQTLFDKLDKDEEPKPVKTKMSYKQQQRMRKNNPMWKPN